MDPESREQWDLVLNELPPGAESTYAEEIAEAEGSGFMGLLQAGGQGVKVG